MKNNDIQTSTREWYKNYYAKKGPDRNNPLKDKSGIFQLLAQERAFIRAMASTEINPAESTLLDVGCGTGSSIINFVKLGFLPENIAGIDILDERIEGCLRVFPCAKFIRADASKIPFDANTFDVVSESTMFI
ncbi:MAG: hypothetical protein CVU77_07125 [Elusimicrobia bacterium HGW-Elusimicrobia-1]|jgi:ubiquinone/menaquinone biosynthesis C-methylase UbiE|nr:MAG: hypothetical protein CVU77_07125 [Elusimicrobia bacterium HGW-Elusimicrobia-1]